MPSAVSGLINAEAPCCAVTPSGKATTSDAGSVRYWVYIRPAPELTTLPTRWRPLAPASTTTPAPSRPRASDLPARPATSASRRSGTAAVVTGRPPVASSVSVSTSAGPSNTARSAGFIGAASTLTSTSSGPGGSTASSSTLSRSWPSGVISERSSSEVTLMFGCPSISERLLRELGDRVAEVELELARGPQPAIAGLAHQLCGDRRAQRLAERRLRRGKPARVRQVRLVEALLGGRKRLSVECEHAPHEVLHELIELRVGKSTVDPPISLCQLGVEVVPAECDLDRP